jgi:RNA polymerase sigma-70 factor (ECF subfamily)
MFNDWTSLRKRLHGYLRKRVAVDAADDVLQDVLLKLHVHASDAPADERSSIAWALRVARNAAIDYHRRRRVTDVLDAAEVASRGTGVSASSELAGCLPQMVRLLPEGYREAVELADLRGWPQRRVAAELGVSTSGAKSRVQRGRQQLAAMLAQCCDVERDAHGGVADFEPTARATEFCGAAERVADDLKKSCVHSRAASSSPATAAMVAAE